LVLLLGRGLRCLMLLVLCLQLPLHAGDSSL
jgi:hypothetical protein